MAGDGNTEGRARQQIEHNGGPSSLLTEKLMARARTALFAEPAGRRLWHEDGRLRVLATARPLK